jgi:hypothetical protein
MHDVGKSGWFLIVPIYNWYLCFQTSMSLDKSPTKNITQDLAVEDEEVKSFSPSDDLPDAGWHEDPMKADELRFWNGTEWTEIVSNDGIVTERAL